MCTDLINQSLWIAAAWGMGPAVLPVFLASLLLLSFLVFLPPIVLWTAWIALVWWAGTAVWGGRVCNMFPFACFSLFVVSASVVWLSLSLFLFLFEIPFFWAFWSSSFIFLVTFCRILSFPVLIFSLLGFHFLSWSIWLSGFLSFAVASIRLSLWAFSSEMPIFLASITQGAFFFVKHNSCFYCFSLHLQFPSLEMTQIEFVHYFIDMICIL